MYRHPSIHDSARVQQRRHRVLAPPRVSGPPHAPQVQLSCHCKRVKGNLELHHLERRPGETHKMCLCICLYIYVLYIYSVCCLSFLYLLFAPLCELVGVVREGGVSECVCVRD